MIPTLFQNTESRSYPHLVTSPRWLLSFSIGCRPSLRSPELSKRERYAVTRCSQAVHWTLKVVITQHQVCTQCLLLDFGERLIRDRNSHDADSSPRPRRVPTHRSRTPPTIVGRHYCCSTTMAVP